MKEITLNDLLAITDARSMMLVVPVVGTLNAQIDLDLADASGINYAVEAYGSYIVKMMKATGANQLKVSLKR